MLFSLDADARPYAEETIKKSRFIGRLRRVESEEAFAAFLAEVREIERGAGHHCYAYVIGDDEESRIERFSDDGEPGGTAGAPMLAALHGRGLVNVAAVVSRYYGGVNLGAGGLVRAYSGTVIAALETAALRPRVRAQLFRLQVEHATAGWVEAELRRRGIEVVKVGYGEHSVITVASSDPDGLRTAVAEITSGAAELVPVGHFWR